MLAQPERAPELIALAAADRFGPQAAEWARIAGAGHSPKQLARVAYKKHVRLARLEGGALGIGGVFTAAPDMVALLWIQSRMVFYIAAAYGYDPCHPMRPAEYLALQGLYDTPANRAAEPDADHPKWVQPAEIARVVRFLVSDDSAPTSGAGIPVYGRA